MVICLIMHGGIDVMAEGEEKKIVTPLQEVIKEIGGMRRIFKEEFIIALAFSMLVLIAFLCKGPDVQSSVLVDLMKSFMTISGALLGFVIAAYSLLLSAGSKNLREKFGESLFYSHIKFSFVWCSILVGICIVTTMLGILFSMFFSSLVLQAIFIFALFIFLWLIFNLIVLIGIAIRAFGDFVFRIE